jgi:AraC-like DNA-binding protein
MSQSPRASTTRIDPLGEALHFLRLTGTLYCRAELTAPWGIQVPELPGSLGFIVITSGRCWLEVEGHEPVVLEQGSLSLIPHGAPHRFASALDARAEPLFGLPVNQISEHFETMTYGGGGEATIGMYASVQFDHAAASRLVDQLPSLISVNSWEDDLSWLHSTVQFIAREAAVLRPGGETVITRLADVLVIQAIRSWLDSSAEARTGWLAALRDEHLGRALAEIHRAPAAPWTVEALAQRAGMSRSAFSARFTDVVGEPAMRYLAQWRLRLAHSHLQHSAEPLAVVAERFGYQSEVAFSRAFKRQFDTTPGSVRAGRNLASR